MDCTKAQMLMIPYITGDLEPGRWQYRQLQAHLLSCGPCAEQYQVRKQTVEFIEHHKAVFAEVLKSPRQERVVRRRDIERRWKCTDARLDKHEDRKVKVAHTKLRRLLVKVSATAACLVIGASVFLLCFEYFKSETASGPTWQRAAFTPRDLFKIECVSRDGRTIIAANHRIASTDRPKTVIINDKHRIMMNADTILVLRPLVGDNHIGCLVELASGQIYAHVQHDANPFVVATSHGRAVITGTAFDIKTTDASTTLVVSEGMVRLESEEGFVDVNSGHLSEITANSVPTEPVFCNTVNLTAWATGAKAAEEPAGISSGLMGSEGQQPSAPVSTLLPELETIDYEDWIAKRGPWFKQEFPWVFELQRALEEEGIAVDYSELLIESGDIWRFAYPESSLEQLSLPDPNLLLEAAGRYGFGKQWLFKNLGAINGAFDVCEPVMQRFVGTEAFAKWAGGFDDAQATSNGLDDELFRYSLHAIAYLANTRMLVWLEIKNNRFAFKTDDEAEVLALLEMEMEILNELTREIFDSLWTDGPCDKAGQLRGKIAKHINGIRDIEERISECEVGSHCLKKEVIPMDR